MQLDLLTRADVPADAITVSPSQLSLWYRCNYAWKLSKLDGVGKEDYKVVGAANKGLIFHSMSKWLYDRSIGRQVGTLNEKGQMAAVQDLQRTHEATREFWEVWAIFMAYCEWAKKGDELVTIGAEVETFADTGLVSRDGRPIYLHGFIDLIADLFGKLVVVDHKSHTNRPWTKARLFYDHQLVFYWILLELQGIDVSAAIVNAINLFIPKDSKKFRPMTTEAGPRFERITLGKHEVKLQFYLDQFLANIKKMWCEEPVYPMRLNSDCQYCMFKDHIELEAKGLNEAAVDVLKAKHGEDFTLIDDLDLENVQ